MIVAFCVLVGLVLALGLATYEAWRWKKAAQSPSRLFAQFAWEGISPLGGELMLRVTSGWPAPLVIDSIELVVEGTGAKQFRRQKFGGAAMEVAPYTTARVGVHRVLGTICRELVHSEGQVSLRVRAVIDYFSQGIEVTTTSIPATLTLVGGNLVCMDTTSSDTQVEYLSYEDIGGLP